MLEMNGQFEERLPLYEKVAGKINFLIETGTLRPGDKVPSIRNFSKQMQVSINTVKEAYSLLEDRRLLEARPQSGYYVRARLPELPAEPVLDRPAINPAEVNLCPRYIRRSCGIILTRSCCSSVLRRQISTCCRLRS